MNGNNNTKLFLEDQLKDVLKEANPVKLTEIIEEMKKLNYSSLLDYIFIAHEIYKGLAEENRKGKLMVMLLHNQTPIKKEEGKICIGLGEHDRIINMKVKGLDYKHNGNGNHYNR